MQNKFSNFLAKLNTFVVFRISLGLYLFYHFFSFFYDQEHVFSLNGPIQNNYKFLPFIWFPNIINFVTDDTSLKLFWLLMCLFSLMLVVGLFRRWVCWPMWYAWACFFNFNTLVINPASSVVGWLILFAALIPSGEPLSFVFKKKKLQEEWQLSQSAVFAVWIFLGYTMSVSGIQKILSSDTWIEGSTLFRIVHDYPLTRLNFVTDFAKIIPASLLKILTWIFLLTEALFLPLIFFKQSRTWIWLLSAFMLVSSLMIIDFAPIPLGILLCHILLITPDLFPQKIKDSLLTKTPKNLRYKLNQIRRHQT